ncbi:MAG: hypothetical protein LBU42_05150 [Prevotellaceae bacterium]|jgi:hypothetical protein|nr:hypothetical protein [Prevotellaceae bacterium]
MERRTTIAQAQQLFGKNFIGVQELAAVAGEFPVKSPVEMPAIPYSSQELAPLAEDYLLLLGASVLPDGKPLNLLSLRERYGINPDLAEPCFYNQDWYLQEDFMTTTLADRWYLLRKNVIFETRAMSPVEILEKMPDFHFPPAILCAYAFFACWFTLQEHLWVDDFVWCDDVDHNGDRIYVGKYHDVDGINKNGFSIHRHLTLRKCYGAVEICK